MNPTKIQIKDSNFFIDWDDGDSSEISLQELRRNCPCAYCSKDREEKRDSYLPIYSDQQVAISEINTVGSYAIGVKWKDGHNTGIFEFSHLKNLTNN